MFSGADLEPILRRFKVVTSAELGPAPPRIEEGGGGEVDNPQSQQQQVMFKQQRVLSEISFFNHPTQGAAEQPGDGPQVQKCLI